jgi:hypothetical protein
VLREVFAMTRGSRAAMTGAAAEHAPSAEADSSEAALARAEAEAILAFEPVPSRKT